MDSPSPSQLCPECAAQMPDSAAFCPACGRPMTSATRASGKVGSLPESLVGGLAYLTFIPAIVLLTREPYKRNFFVRFHAIQCLLLWVAMVGAAAAVKIIVVVVSFIPVAGPLFEVLITMMAALAAFLLWVVLVVKALQGERFKLPLLGNLAEGYAGSP